MRTSPHRAELYERACRVLPGGVNSPVRAMRQIGRDPIFIERGEGCELFDVEGNRYLDWVGSWGPLILGHAEPSVIARASRTAPIAASVPELVIRTISTAGKRSAICSASSTSIAVAAP